LILTSSWQNTMADCTSLILSVRLHSKTTLFTRQSLILSGKLHSKITSFTHQ